MENVDLVIIRYGDEVSVLYGRCLHRGALLADGFVRGHNLICGLHNWDYRVDTGVSEYNNSEILYKFKSEIREGAVYVDAAEVREYHSEHPQPFQRDEYLGNYSDTHPENTEPYTSFIQNLARNGLKSHHGPSEAMGVDRNTLPKWEDIQFLPAQLARKPLLDDAEVNTKVVIGPKSDKPLILDIPIFVSDMSFGALSFEAKVALSKGAELAGTGICSGEGGMLPDEQANNSRYFYEFASGKFGFSLEKVKKAQAFHLKEARVLKQELAGISREIKSQHRLRMLEG